MSSRRQRSSYRRAGSQNRSRGTTPNGYRVTEDDLRTPNRSKQASRAGGEGDLVVVYPRGHSSRSERSRSALSQHLNDEIAVARDALKSRDISRMFESNDSLEDRDRSTEPRLEEPRTIKKQRSPSQVKKVEQRKELSTSSVQTDLSPRRIPSSEDEDSGKKKRRGRKSKSKHRSPSPSDSEIEEEKILKRCASPNCELCRLAAKANGRPGTAVKEEPEKPKKPAKVHPPPRRTEVDDEDPCVVVDEFVREHKEKTSKEKDLSRKKKGKSSRRDRDSS